MYPTGEAAGDGRQLAQLFKAHCGAQGVDVVCDPVGGAYAEPALRSMAWGGRYLVVGFAAGDIPRIPLNLPLLKGCDIQGVLYGAHAQRDPAAVQVEIEELLALYLAGAIRPHVSARFPLSQGGRCHRRDRIAAGARQARRLQRRMIRQSQITIDVNRAAGLETQGESHGPQPARD